MLFVKKKLSTITTSFLSTRYGHGFYIYLQDIHRADLTKQASAMAYTTLFSLVPSLAAIFTLLGLFLPILGDNASLLNDLRSFLFRYLATGSGHQVIQYLETFIAGLDLKRIGISAFVGLLITLVILLRQIEQALNSIWLVTQARPMLTRFIYFWLFLTLGMFGISILIGLSTSYSVATLITQKTLAVADQADNFPIFGIITNWALNCLIFFLIYKVVPNCDVQNKAASRGAILAGTLFYILSKLYTIYVSNFANYKSIYGTLAALPIFLMWIYVCWLILLAGALFAWRWQTGFPQKQMVWETVETEENCLQRHRNHQLRSQLPFLVMVVILDNFSKGAGKGISASELVSTLNLPHSWIHESLHTLLDTGFIVPSKHVHDAPEHEDRWFPAQPAEDLTTDEFAKKLGLSLTKWHESWEPKLQDKFKALFARIELPQNLEAKTFKQILAN